MSELPENTKKFWFKFIEANCVERIEMLKELLAGDIRACYTVYSKDKNLGIHCLVSLLNGYFEDFEKALKLYVQG